MFPIFPRALLIPSLRTPFLRLSRFPTLRALVRTSWYREEPSTTTLSSAVSRKLRAVKPSVPILRVSWVLSAQRLSPEKNTPKVIRPPCFPLRTSVTLNTKPAWPSVRAVPTVAALPSTVSPAGVSTFPETAANAVSVKLKTKTTFRTFLTIN